MVKLHGIHHRAMRQWEVDPNQDIGTMKFASRGIAQRNLTARHVKEFLPAEMSGSLGLAPGVAVARFVPPVARVLDGHDGGEQAATVSRHVVRSPFSAGARF